MRANNSGSGIRLRVVAKPSYGSHILLRVDYDGQRIPVWLTGTQADRLSDALTEASIDVSQRKQRSR